MRALLPKSVSFVFIIVFFLLSMISPVAADQYRVQYDIQDTVRVTVTVNITASGNEYRIYLPLDADNIVEEQNVPYSLVTLSDKKIAVFNLSSTNSSSLSLHYTTQELVDENTFVVSNHVADDGSYTLYVVLPEAVILETSLESPRPSVFRHPSRVESDGQRLHITWEGLKSSEPVLVKFKRGTEFPWKIVLVILGALFLIIILIIIMWYVKNKKRNKREQINNKGKSEEDKTEEEQNSGEGGQTLVSLYEEEQKIIDALNAVPQHELWQKELLQKTGLTKVKLSRRLRSLEQRAMIEKIPYGNTNKIRIKSSTKVQ